MKEREIAMTQIQQKLRDDLTKASSVLARKVLFDDSKNDVYNQFNVATFDRKRQQQQKEFVDVWLKHFHQFISHYGDYFSAFHERLLILNKSMTITDALRNINRKVPSGLVVDASSLVNPRHDGCMFIPDHPGPALAHQVLVRHSRGHHRHGGFLRASQTASPSRPSASGTRAYSTWASRRLRPSSPK